MKRLSFYAVAALLLLFTSAYAQQPLTIKPEKPKPGEKITITYNTAGTELFGVENPEAYAYLLEGGLPIVKEVKLTKNGTSYTGDFSTNDSTQTVFLSFAKDQKRDNNGDKGYYTLLYSGDAQPVPGSKKCLAAGLMLYGGIWELKNDGVTGLRIAKEAIAEDPAIIEKKPLDFFNLLINSKNEADLAMARNILDKMVANPGTSEADLTTAKFEYQNRLKDKEKAEATNNIIRKRFPQGAWIKAAQVEKFYAERDPDKQAAIYNEIKSGYNPAIPNDKRTLGNLAYTLAAKYSAAGNIPKFKEYVSLITERSSAAMLYNNLAWKETGESVDAKPGNLELGKEFSKKSLELIEEQKKDLSSKPPFRTEAQYLKNLSSNYSMYADTYALLLYHSKDYQQAYDIQKKAIDYNKRRDASMNEAYIVYLEKVKGQNDLKKELEEFVKTGTYSGKMKSRLKEIYISEKKSEAGWDGYLATLEAERIAAKKAEILKSMITEPAPGFILKDIKGNEITLASLKGKVVVVDFWATWCGPCKASFPGMKLAVEKYREDKDVKFVFIDTWESGEKDAIKKNVAEFIEKNAYPFHVLMDMDAKTVEAFKVEGIPTKFVIDANGRIRFRSVGFSGSADGLAIEVAMMIEMSRSGATADPKKKAF